MSFVKWIPFLLKIRRRARVLEGATQSKTTKAQALVAFPVALLVAFIGFWVPELAADPVSFALTSAIIGVSAPIVSRLLAFKAADDSLNDFVMLTAVRYDAAKGWRPYTGSVLDAREEGCLQGLDSFGSIYDVQDGGKPIGTIRLQNCTTEQSNRAMRAFMSNLKALNSNDRRSLS